jgi:hypothetical protein
MHGQYIRRQPTGEEDTILWLSRGGYLEGETESGIIATRLGITNIMQQKSYNQ